MVVVRSTFSHQSFTRKGKKVWECEDYFPKLGDRDLDPSEIRLVLVDNYEGFDDLQLKCVRVNFMKK